MKTGVIIIGMDSEEEGLHPFAERCAQFLKDRGRKDVRISYYYGGPVPEM